MRHLTIFLLVLGFVSGCAASLRGPEMTDSGVRFSLHAPEATSISLAGNFNRWSATSDLLGGPDKNGVWSLVKPLTPGRYEYRFIVNNRDWILDPHAPSIDDGLGERNSVIVVSP
jgi:1,4-alpha-glucan branching enzyme